MKQNLFKPCPFCGHQEDLLKVNTRHYYGPKEQYKETDYYLECDNCGLIVGNDKIYDQWGDNVCDYSTPESALEFWNKRHDDSKIDALSQSLKDLIEWANIKDGSAWQHLRDNAINALKKTTE